MLIQALTLGSATVIMHRQEMTHKLCLPASLKRRVPRPVQGRLQLEQLSEPAYKPARSTLTNAAEPNLCGAADCCQGTVGNVPDHVLEADVGCPVKQVVGCKLPRVSWVVGAQGPEWAPSALRAVRVQLKMRLSAERFIQLPKHCGC